MPKRWVKLMGVTKTPVVTKRRRFFHKLGVITITGRPRVFGKLKKEERRPPKTYRAWYGTVEFVVPEYKFDQALSIDKIGAYTNEGMGHVIWKRIKQLNKKPDYTPKQIEIRKMLPTDLSETQENLMLAMLLHDFVHTENHKSKIYHEVTIVDKNVYNLVKNHHNYRIDQKELPLLSILQSYDRLSAMISRKFRWSTSSRYRVTELEKIDFNTLKKEIAVRQNSLCALYTYIRKSDVLNKINEALTYGFSSLKNHLLLMVNLYLNELEKTK